MCTKADNSCRDEKLGCKGCYYDYSIRCNELLKCFTFYNTLSPSNLRKIGNLLKNIIISKYNCKIDCTLFKTEEIVLEVSFSRLCLNISFNIEHLLRTELNTDYILNCVDYAILNYYRK